MKKRIILFIDSLVSGGAQRQLVTLARSLHDCGHDVSFLTYQPEEQLGFLLDQKKIPRVVIKKKSKIDIMFAIMLFNYFKAQKPGCIISYLNTPNFWARLIGRLAGVNKIITSERNIDIHKSYFRLHLEKLLYPMSDHVIVNAHAIKDLLVENKLPPNKIKVIYNGLDLEYFSRRGQRENFLTRSKLGIDEEDFVITLPGRIAPQKNHISLLKAAVLIDDLPDNVKFLFVGNEIDSKIKADLLIFCNENELSDRVIFGGPIDDMPSIYSISNIVVLPSLWEGLPNVIIEAMACETPVIASDVSDNRLIISQEENGYVFSTSDLDAFSNALFNCIHMDSKQLIQMGVRGRQRVSTLCSMENFISSYQKIIYYD